MVARPVDAFKTIAGVVPCPGGWLVLPAHLAGITTVAESAFTVATLAEVLDYRPKFDFIAINIAFGVPATPGDRFRPCDDQARELIGWPRMASVRPLPSRPALFAASQAEAKSIEPWLGHDDFRQFRWLREAATEIQPFHSRSVFSGCAALSFTHMNGDLPLRSSPYLNDGRIERLELIREKLPGVDEILTRAPPPGAGQVHMYSAAAMLWSARRAAGRAISRLPLDPEWDEFGIRMELVR